MASVTDRLGELRLSDLATFLAVRRAGSISSAARELGVTPSQVSKAIDRLQSALRIQLLSRGSKGLGLSEAGLRALPHIEAAVTRLLAAGNSQSEAAEVTIAAPSFLLGAFLPALEANLTGLVVRGLELPPPLLRAYSAEDFFDMCLMHKTTARLPVTWSSVNVGQLRQGLFASPAVARRLGPQPLTPERLQSVPFISPVYFADGQLVPVNDDCPLARNDRVVGHQVFTIVLALELAARTEQVLFGPLIAAHEYVRDGRLVEVKVEGWNVEGPLYLACNEDRVLARVRNGVADIVRETMRGIGRT